MKTSYSDEELRAACNEETSCDTIAIALSLFQRMTIALEGINKALNETPTALFEAKGDAPQTDGLGLFDVAAKDETEH